MKKAIALAHTSVSTAIKYGEIAIKCSEYRAFVDYYYGAPKKITENGRIKMYVGQCLVELGELSRSKEFINENLVVEDFKEGEYSISSIWTKMHKKELVQERGCSENDISDEEVDALYKLPYSIDYRMH